MKRISPLIRRTFPTVCTPSDVRRVSPLLHLGIRKAPCMRHALLMPDTSVQSGTAEPQTQVPALRAMSFPKFTRWSRTELGCEVSQSALVLRIALLAGFFLPRMVNIVGCTQTSVVANCIEPSTPDL